MSSARERRFRYPKPISTPPGTTGRLRSSLSFYVPPLLGGKGTAHAGSTWVTCQIREKEEEEEKEGLFKADAVNEEDPERDRATQV